MARPLKVLDNAKQALDALIAHGAMSPQELTDATGIPRSSAYRLLEGLAAIDLVRTTDVGKFEPSVRWLHLADAARSALPRWTTADDVVSAVAERTGLTAYLALPREDGAVCIDWRQGRGVSLLMLRPGGTLPRHAGALGRLVLAFGDSPRDDAEPRERFTPATLVDDAALQEDAERTRQHGYVLSVGDVTTGVAAVGVPVLVNDALVAMVSAGGLETDVASRVDALVPELQRAADRLAISYRREHRLSAV